MTLTPEAMRAARAILHWSMRHLAEQSGVGVATINAIENGRPCRDATAQSLVATFARHGVEVLPSPNAGARLIGASEL